MNFTSLAADLVMQDLVDCLLAEDFFGREPLSLQDTAHWQARHPQAPKLEGQSSTQQIWEWRCGDSEQRFWKAAAGLTGYTSMRLTGNTFSVAMK